MTLRVTEVVIDCADHGAVVDFWAAAMGYERREVNEQYVALVPPPPATPGRPPLLFQKVPEPKVAKNRVHLDLRGEVDGRRGGAARRPRRDGHRGAVAGQPHLDGDGRPGGQRVLRLGRRLSSRRMAGAAARASPTGARRPFARLERLASGPGGVALMVAWGFAEATVFPVIPDVGLLLLVLVVPRRWAALFGAAVAGGLAGTVVLYLATMAAPDAVERMLLALPGIHPPMLTAAASSVASGTPWSFTLVGPGTPLKVYTFAWATGPAAPAALLVGVVLNRLLRIVPGLVVAHLVGRRASAFIRRHDLLVLAFYAGMWVVGYAVYWGVVTAP